MRKRLYIKPQQEVININMNCSLLITSDDIENYNINEDEIDAENAL